LFRYRLDGDRVVEGGSVSDGGNLFAWLGRTLRLPDDVDVAGRAPDAHGLTFLPLLGGERSPGWNGRAHGAIAGLTFDTQPIDVLQAALEGMAYRFALIAEALPELRHVVATGGAVRRDPGWVQILADVLERPLQLSPVAESSARGAAVITLQRIGETPANPPPGDVFEPRLDRAHAYRSARQRQLELYTKVTT
jgi:gluconokinase